MRRRALLPLLALTGCGAIGTPYVETIRFPLDPRRVGARRPSTGRTLLLRTMRGAPGLETRSLRRVRADGTLDVAFYDGWMAPPADLAEAALRAWLTESGLFTAVTAPGSRLHPSLILETDLTALEARLGDNQGRAALAALLLSQPEGQEARPVAQLSVEGVAPLDAAAGTAGQAAAMQAALGEAFGRLEERLAAAIPRGAARR
jgi:ABC-type uncharacterized transport system auxiliary subunit